MNTLEEVFVVTCACTFFGKTETLCTIFKTFEKAQKFMKEDFEDCKQYFKDCNCNINTLFATITNEKGDTCTWNIEKRLIH